ncbi:LOW QUALITY PROTEIN: rab11 family-interacting protein 1 [Perca fluviatilis]|uniref:LOW QUALITY PROTEIN: rab11 family-interacting protein 1 n=1 Tax=Perca fluviatilis TaxID=8168 RepID=UPI00196687C1|nr:LOW QUALITY PROTEIN: rab11 family-interacting protein 1 [Perca fluviatilis]
MSSLTVEEDQKWLPTHVQVTVLRGRGLRGKGKHGTSDVYTIIQLGKEKYSTCVLEKTTEPEWREECSFELHPGVLENGGRSSYPAGSNELVLIVMHRALIGMDVFLGQAVIQLDKVFHETRYVKNEWYKLNSKTGKKEKERGDIQVSVQFTRNNLTASMYELVMKDKGVSTFGKLKERIKGKRRSSEEDSSSAVLPSGYGSLYRIRQRLPSDGGGEEDYEDDEGGEARRSKMRTYFLRGKLRKSSDTRSCTSLGSESSESSSRGGSLSPTAGISVVVSDLSNSPSNSSNLTVDNSPEHTENTSPKASSLTCEFGDDDGEISIAVPIVCVNGSHAYSIQPLDPGSGKPADSLGLGLLQKSLPLSTSLQNLRPSTDLPKGSVGDGRRWSFDKPGEEEKAAIAAALEQSGPMLGDEEEQSGQAAQPKYASSSSSMAESESQGRKQRRNLFSHGRSESAGKGQSQSKDESEQAPAATEEKHKGWFGSKDSHSKPSLVVSPKLEPSTDPHPPPLPPSHHPPGPPVDPASVLSPLHHTNPFCHSQTTPPAMSPCNPFFSLLQHNPFYYDMLTAQPLKPSLPPLPFLSSSRPPIVQLFPQASNPNPNLAQDNPTTEDSVTGTDAKSEAMAKDEKRPLPPVPMEEEKPLSVKLLNPILSAGELDPDSEWDESFEAFAAGRLQCPEDLTTDCKTQQNTPSDHPLEHCNDKGASLPLTDQNTNVNDALHHQPCTEFAFEAPKAIRQATNTNTYHLDTFAQFLETIPEHTSFESDNIALNAFTNSPKLDACTETNHANRATNTNDLTDTNVHHAPCHSLSVKLNSSSPDPGSSGLGSSAEEDFLSCLSSYSDKFSASSSEEAEAQNFESNVLGFEKSFDSSVGKNVKPSESEGDITDGSSGLSLVDVDQHTVIQHRDGDGKADLHGSEGSLAPESPVLIHQQPVMAARETGEDALIQAPNFSNVIYSDLPKLSELQPKPDVSLQPDNENGEKGIGEFSGSVEDFSKVLNDSSRSVSNTTTPDYKLCSTHPSLYIITSSPDVRQSLSDSAVESTSSGPIPFRLFGDFLNTSRIANSPSQDSDDTLWHTRVPDLSTSSFFQSLYVSTDSQDYQTCVSHPSTKCSSGSEPNETLHSVNSTLCGEPSEIPTTADAALGQEDPANACKPCDEEINQTDQSEESFCGAEDKMTALEPSVTTGEKFGLLPAAQADSYMSCSPRKLIEPGVVCQHVVLGDVFSKCPQAQNATLHRSQSEGILTPAFDELLLPSFGSDPGAIQESSSDQHGPDLPSLASFAPSLSPQSSSSPVALCSLPPLANATARSPPSTAPAAAPKPMLQETRSSSSQQQAANQQNSPHPVKPLTTAILSEEKRTEGRSVLATGLEKLKSTIHPGRSSQLSEQDPDRKKPVAEGVGTGAGSYYHLNHSELVALLVQREAELQRQKAEFERQKSLLAKREVELKKLKPQVKDLEDYIDTLLVRIMEQKPTLLQVRSKLK